MYSINRRELRFIRLATIFIALGLLIFNVTNVFGKEDSSNLVSLILNEEKTVTSADGAGDDRFGHSVAISGNYAVVGAKMDNIGSNLNNGSAYVFHRQGDDWVEVKKLTASDGLANDEFGTSVDIDGDTIIVGSVFNDNLPTLNPGAAYIFVRNGNDWIEQDKLMASDGIDNDNFGNSVAIDGNTAIIGANFDESGIHISQGAAYVFTRSGSNWTEQDKLIASDGGGGDNFGWSVGIDGNSAIVSAYADDVNEISNRGSAYVFTRSGNDWTEQDKLIASDGLANDTFGYDVDIEGDTAVIGAESDTTNTTATKQGSAYIFTRNGDVWTEKKKLTASDGGASEHLGRSVAISEHTVVVGAYKARGGASQIQIGAAYVYKRSNGNWAETRKLEVSDGVGNDFFGGSVDIDNGRIVGGSSGAFVATLSQMVGQDQGTANFFDLGRIISTAYDFDGDGRTDPAIYRPTVGEWWHYRSSDNGNGAVQFGTNTDFPVAADYTGDGITDVALFRRATGEWFVLRSEDQSFYSFPFGNGQDVAMAGDFDGDGKADPTVFRASEGTWYILKSSTGQVDIRAFGVSGDSPRLADFDGDGITDIAVYRYSTQVWWINRSTDGVIAYQFGIDQTDLHSLVPADYTGDGKADIAFIKAVGQPANLEWFILRSEDASFYSYPFGLGGDFPAVGDYDGDGTADSAVFRQNNSTWYIQQSTSGINILSFGSSGDRPVALYPVTF